MDNIRKYIILAMLLIVPICVFAQVPEPLTYKDSHNVTWTFLQNWILWEFWEGGTITNADVTKKNI